MVARAQTRARIAGTMDAAVRTWDVVNGIILMSPLVRLSTRRLVKKGTMAATRTRADNGEVSRPSPKACRA